MTTPADPTPPAEAPATPAGDTPASSRRALPFAIGGVAVLVAILLFALLSRENDSNPVDDVSAALQAQAALIAGPLNVTALQHTKCVAGEGNDYTCTPVMNNTEASGAVTVRYSGDALTKRLAGTQLTEMPRAGDEVAKALDADELATMKRTVKYGCAFTTGMNPDGSSNAGSPGGFRCATATRPPGASDVLQRYVEFAEDGTVRRDFMLSATS